MSKIKVAIRGTVLALAGGTMFAKAWDKAIARGKVLEIARYKASCKMYATVGKVRATAMKKTMVFLMVAVMMLAMGTSYTSNGYAEVNINFTDTSGHWAVSSISTAVAKGYVDGYPDGTFKPEQNVSRAEFIKLAVTALKLTTKPTVGQQWHEPFVLAAVASGIHTYEDYTSGDIHTPITRDEMARLAVRSTGEKNTDALKWMYLAASKGIINGMDDQGTVGADQPTTRAQAITVIERMLKLQAGEKLPLDKYATSAAEIAWHRTNVYTMAPEYFGDAKKRNEPFYWDKTRVESELGYSEIEKYVVVDMGDPLDPNRKLIPENMVWNMQVGKSHTFTKDVPLNSYAFLSFNHFVRYNADQPTRIFRFAHLRMSSFDLYTNDNIDDKGNLIQITFFGSYVEKSESMTVGSKALVAGESEVYITTGQLGPKSPPLKLNSNQTSVYKMAAVELGDDLSRVVFSSVFTPLPNKEETEK
jgi:hypothetical protein